MKALRLHAPNLIYEEAPIPKPTASAPILIHISATSLTRDQTTWPPVISRSLPIPGHSISGTVASISLPSDQAQPYHPGDTVYGLLSFTRDGGAANFTLAHPSELAHKPSNVSHVEAASIPMSALTAWQALFVHSGLIRNAEVAKGCFTGKRILVTGAAGGVGVLGVQLARWAGAEVVALCSPRSGNAEAVKGLGATRVVNSVEEVVKQGGEVDMVLDCTGGEILRKAFGAGVVRDGGVVVSIAEPPKGEWTGEAGKRGVKGVYFIVGPDGAQLERISKLVEEGEVRGMVGAVFGLDEGEKAMAVLEEGRTRGKVVLRVEG